MLNFLSVLGFATSFALCSCSGGSSSQVDSSSTDTETNQDDTTDDSDTNFDSSGDSDTSVDTGSDSETLQDDTTNDSVSESESNTGADTDSISDSGSDPDDALSFPLRGAFYYPWFPETWSVKGDHVFYDVALGYYDSGDVEIIDRHIEMMDYAKIDVAIASWWGEGTQKEKTRIPRLLERTEALGSSLKWAFYYEDEGFGDPSSAQITGDLEYLETSYGDSPSLARIDGKPVVFVYNADDPDCELTTRWSKADTENWYVSLKVFKGYADCADQPDTWHQYGPNSPTNWHKGYTFGVSPGFWRADQDLPMLARDITRFNQNVRDMVASGEPWQLITTFNEWGEGTAVEPAAEWASASGFGQYLDALHSDGQ